MTSFNTQHFSIAFKEDVFRPALKIQVVVCWVLKPCRFAIGYQRFRETCYRHLMMIWMADYEDGMNMVLRNVGVLQQHNMASKFRRSRLEEAFFFMICTVSALKWHVATFASHVSETSPLQFPPRLLPLAPQPSLGLGLFIKIRLNFLEASQQYSFLQGRFVSPTPNPHPEGPGLCIYIPQRQGG
jgi:hypothetical protein